MSKTLTLKHANILERLFPRMMEKFFPEAESRLPHLDIRVAQIRTLSYLLEHEGCTMGELGEALNLACSTVTGNVGRMVRTGLLRRFANPGDRRQVRVKLTPKGKKSIQKFIHFRRQSIAGKLRMMSFRDQQTLVRSFQNIDAVLSKTLSPIQTRVILLVICLAGEALFSSHLHAQTLYNLQQSLKKALLSNHGLKQKESELLEARAKLKESKASIFPQISLHSTLTKLQEARSSSFGGVKVLFASDLQILSRLSLSQPLYTSGKLQFARALVEKSYSAEHYELQKFRNDLAFQVKDVYYRVLQSLHLLEVARAAVKSAQKHFEVTESLKQQGVMSKYDVLRAKVALTSARQKLIQAENNLATQQSAFRFIAGIDLREEFVLQDADLSVNVYSLVPSVTPEEAALYALEHRPEVLMAQLRVDMEKQNRRIEKVSGFPALYFSANYDLTRGERIPILWRNIYSFDLTLTMSLYDSGIKSSRVNQTTARIIAAEDALIELKRKVALEVGNGFLMLSEALSRAENSRAGLDEAKLGLSLAEERYENGVGTLVEVLDAQTAYESAQAEFYSSIYDFYRALAQLDKAMGKGEETS